VRTSTCRREVRIGRLNIKNSLLESSVTESMSLSLEEGCVEPISRGAIESNPMPMATERIVRSSSSRNVLMAVSSFSGPGIVCRSSDKLSACRSVSCLYLHLGETALPKISFAVAVKICVHDIGFLGIKLGVTAPVCIEEVLCLSAGSEAYHLEEFQRHPMQTVVTTSTCHAHGRSCMLRHCLQHPVVQMLLFVVVIMRIEAATPENNFRLKASTESCALALCYMSARD